MRDAALGADDAMSGYLYHVTLDTAHVRQSPRSEVADSVIERLRPHIGEALATGASPIPIDGGYRLKATATGAFLVSTVLSSVGAPVVTFGVAPRSRGAGKLWLMLQDGHDYPTVSQRPPSAPWCAARIDNAALVIAADWLGDYERCIAWTWIEMRREP